MSMNIIQNVTDNSYGRMKMSMNRIQNVTDDSYLRQNGNVEDN